MFFKCLVTQLVKLQTRNLIVIKQSCFYSQFRHISPYLVQFFDIYYKLAHVIHYLPILSLLKMSHIR